MDAWTPPNTEYPPPKHGEPALHRAARLGDAAEIRRLVADGAGLNEVFDLGLDPGAHGTRATPLMVAAGSGDGASAETVRLLLELGADPRCEIDGCTAASFACGGLGWNYKPGGDVDRLRLVLAAGSPFPKDARDANRMLCDAAETGNAELLRILIDAGLNARGHWDPKHAREQSRRMEEGLAKLRSTLPDPFAGLPDELRAMMAETSETMNVVFRERMNAAPSPFEIPLFCAAKSGDAECVSALLDAGADPLARDNSGRSAMYSATTGDVARALIAAGTLLEDADQHGWSPLVAAVCDGGEAIPRVRALIEAGADVNATHDRSYTVFMSAVGSGRCPEVLRLLIAAGADPHAVSELGYNAFHAAIDVSFEANAEESVRDTLGYLKQLAVDLELRTQAGQTPLARAIDCGTGLEVAVLCELGADPNAVCPMHQCGAEACTATDQPLLLHAAAGSGVDKDVKTRALLEAGADPLVVDADGFTAMDLVAAKLCSQAADHREAWIRLHDGLASVRAGSGDPPTDRGVFLAAAIPAIGACVESFAATIPIPKTCEFDEAWRRESVALLTILAAHTAWARAAARRGRSELRGS